jgi:hypothetical protein
MDGSAPAPRSPVQVQHWAYVLVRFCLSLRVAFGGKFSNCVGVAALRRDRGSVSTGPPLYYDELTIEQKAALEPPGHHSRRAKQSNDYQQLRDRLAAAEAELTKQKANAKL